MLLKKNKRSLKDVSVASHRGILEFCTDHYKSRQSVDCRRNGAGLLVVCAVFIIRDRATDPSGNDYKIVQESDVMVKFNQKTGCSFVWVGYILRKR